MDGDKVTATNANRIPR